MTNNTDTKPHTTPGFAIQLRANTDLGLAMLIAEDEEEHYEPVAVVSSICEARELAQSDLRGRLRRLERDADPGICPFTYKVWAQGIDGGYRLAITLSAQELA